MSAVVDVLKQWLPRKPRVRNLTHQPRVSRKVGLEDAGNPALVHGSARVRNGRVHVTDPQPGGAFAAIQVPDIPSLRVTVDGQPVVGKVVVTAASRVHVELMQTDPFVQYELKASPNGLDVHMAMEVRPGKAYQLADAPPRRLLVLSADEQDIWPRAIDPRAVLQRLADEGFRGDVDEQALQEICRAQTNLTKVVLRGVPGRPGLVQKLIPLKNRRHADVAKRNLQLALIEAGETIALYEPAVPGVPGTDVYGHPIAPTTDRMDRPAVRLGDGVLDINGSLVAKRGGRLIFTRQYIDVVPELILNHDIHPKDGDIEFDGSIVVRGSILDGARVRATGQITVYGHVLGALVYGAQGIVVTGNITGSKVWAGHVDLMYRNITRLARQIIDGINALHRDFTAVVDLAKSKGQALPNPALITAALLDQKYGSVTADLRSFLDEYTELLPVDASYRSLAEYVRTKWAGIHQTTLTDSDMLQAILLFTEFEHQLISGDPPVPAPIRAAAAASSSLQASGNIIISDSGTFSSYLHSGGAITVQGAVRGGFLVANRAIRIGEAGTPYGTECSVRVTSSEGIIAAATRHPNTLFDIAGFRQRNLLTEYGVRMHYPGEESR